VNDPTSPPPPPQGQQPQQGTQQIQVPIDADEMENVYVNFFRITPTLDEVLLDLGLHAQLIGPTGPEPVHLTHRLIMNFVTAKKLAEVLRLVVARHEQAFGVVEVDPNRRLRGAQQQPRPQG
jgi:hypothetical protein